jgi:hypothetical protein
MMYDWNNNPDVTPIRLQSMAEICGKGKKPKRLPDDALGKVLRQIKKGRRVFYEAPDGERWRIRATKA